MESGNVSIVLNGEVGKEIKCRRGLRQGDPLSPLIFTLVADGLNIMLQKAKTAGLIQGVGDNRSQLQVMNIQYADDTLIFGRVHLNRQQY